MLKKLFNPNLVPSSGSLYIIIKITQIDHIPIIPQKTNIKVLFN
jgi:hypothetical protein